MSIQELSLKLKGLGRNTEVMLGVLIVVVSFSSFVLGRLSVTENAESSHGVVQVSNVIEATQPLTVETDTVVPSGTTPKPSPVVSQTKTVPVAATEGMYVGSKNGTKYHLPWCGSAKQIKEENRVWFASKEEAELAGYTPASTCKGI